MITIAQKRLERPAELEADIVVCTSSWDARSTSVLKWIRAPQSVVLLRYENPGLTGVSGDHGSQLTQWAEHRELLEIPYASERVVSSTENALDMIIEQANALGQGVRIVIDLATTTRYFSMRAARALMDVESIRSISYLYEGATYAQSPTTRSAFTSGEWSLLALPEPPGRPAAPIDRYALSLGFDGEDTYRLLTRVKPRSTVAIVADPPASPGLVERCIEANRAALTEWVDPSELFHVGAFDAEGIVQLLTPFARDSGTTAFVPLGTKPHALGMAVAALNGTSATVIYRWPQAHTENIVTPTGEAYSYALRNVDAFDEAGSTKFTHEQLNGGKGSAGRRVFICYARADNSHIDPDRRWLDRLRTHLQPLVRQADLDVWCDEDLAAGSDWSAEIVSRISQCRVAILLVSAAFLASEYVAECELPTLLSRARTGNGLVVVPVFVSPSVAHLTRIADNDDSDHALEQLVLTSIQGVNRPSRTLEEMSTAEQDRTLVKIAETILSIVSDRT